jgi:pyruvate dehydrogenase E2 component (dihydrolipoamide acetyltransferase)
MAETILMPKQGNTVESCIILEWKKQEGDTISAGEILCEVETDKATIEVESSAEGTILKLLYEADDDVPVQVPIAIVGEPGEDISGLVDTTPAAKEQETQPEVPVNKQDTKPASQQSEAAAPSTEALQFVSPRARAAARKYGVDASQLSGTGAKSRVIEDDVIKAASDRSPATPAAKAAAAEHGYSAPAQGSGIGGRVRTRDLYSPTAAAPEIAASYQDIPVRSIRKITGARMHESLAATAQLTMDAAADARALLNLRKRFKSTSDQLGLSSITIGDIVLYAVAKTLKDFPEVNSHFLGDTIRQFSHVHLGFAVDTPKGLMVPVIHGADELSLKELSDQVKVVTERCLTGKATPEDLSGGTSTVSNLGAFGIESFTPVLNIPQTAIFGVCSINLKPIELDGEIQFIPHIGISMTFDHQSLDGAPAARFLKKLTETIAHIDLMLAV